MASKHDDVKLTDLCAGTRLVHDKVGAGDEDRFPLGLLDSGCIALSEIDVLDRIRLVSLRVPRQTTEDEDMPVGNLTHRSVASRLEQ